MTDIDRIDHPFVLTTNLDALAEAYRGLGFTLTPQSSRHVGTDPSSGAQRRLGTANRHVVFGDNSIELLGLMDPDAPDPWGVRHLAAAYEGIRGVVFGCADAYAVNQRLTSTGVATTGVLELQREVATPDGEATMRARLVHLLPPTPEGGVGVAEHLTLELVRQPRHSRHPNGAEALSAVTLVVPDEEVGDYVRRYRMLLAVTAEPEGPRHVFQLRAGHIDIVAASAMGEVLPGETAPTLPFLAALTVHVADLDAARSVVRANGVATHPLPGGFFVRAADACGASVVFTGRCAQEGEG